MGSNGKNYEDGKRYTLQRTERNKHGVNEGLTRAELIELANGVQATNPKLAAKIRTVAGDA